MSVNLVELCGGHVEDEASEHIQDGRRRLNLFAMDALLARVEVKRGSPGRRSHAHAVIDGCCVPGLSKDVEDH